jgi:hypothetical protein
MEVSLARSAGTPGNTSRIGLSRPKHQYCQGIRWFYGGGVP